MSVHLHPLKSVGVTIIQSSLFVSP